MPTPDPSSDAPVHKSHVETKYLNAGVDKTFLAAMHIRLAFSKPEAADKVALYLVRTGQEVLERVEILRQQTMLKVEELLENVADTIIGNGPGRCIVLPFQIAYAALISPSHDWKSVGALLIDQCEAEPNYTELIQSFESLADAQPHILNFKAPLRIEPPSPKVDLGELSLQPKPALNFDDIPPPSVFTVPSSAATLTSTMAVNLLAQTCDTLSTEGYFQAPPPRYEPVQCEDHHEAGIIHLHLPMLACLQPQERLVIGKMRFPWNPEHRDELVLHPAEKRARAEAALEACKRLYRAGAIDDQLRPVKEGRGKLRKDADDVEHSYKPIAELHPVMVCNPFGDPWQPETELYLTVLTFKFADGNIPSIGFVSGLQVQQGDIYKLWEYMEPVPVTVVSSTKIEFANAADRSAKLLNFKSFTKTAVQLGVTRRPINDVLLYFLAPLLEDHTIDEETLKHPLQSMGARHAILVGQIVYLPYRGIAEGRVCEVLELRQDLKLNSPFVHPDGKSRKETHNATTWKQYVETEAVFPVKQQNDYIVKMRQLFFTSKNNLMPYDDKDEPADHYMPKCYCKTSRLGKQYWRAVSLFPSLLRKIHDAGRARHTIQHFSLPPIDVQLAVEALTVPSCGTPYDYERLECLGDSNIKLAVTVYVYQSRSKSDESGLSSIRANSVDNLHLRRKALQTGYSDHIINDIIRTIRWRPPHVEDGVLQNSGKTLARTIHRRALSDSLEAMLGAAYLTGGMPFVVQTAAAFKLCVGGPTDWSQREVQVKHEEIEAGPALKALEERYGHTFKYGKLLLQAVTHRSLEDAETYCYEREEFLGDAVLDTWALDRLFKKFPEAKPAQYTLLRAILVNNSILSYLGVTKLQVHKHILHSSQDLADQITKAVTEAYEIQKRGFDFDDMFIWGPPKALADVVEALIGAAFIDSNYNVEIPFALLDKLFEGFVDKITIDQAMDPISSLIQTVQSNNCHGLTYKVERRSVNGTEVAHGTFKLHDVVLASHEDVSKHVAKMVSAKKSLAKVGDVKCTCDEADPEAFEKMDGIQEQDDYSDLDDEA